MSRIIFKEHPNTSEVLNSGGRTDPLLSDSVTPILVYVIHVVTCQAIALLGFGTNIVNIICFIKQGFKDPVNISLTGLAVADLGCLLTQMWNNAFLTPALSAADLPFDSNEFVYFTSGMSHITFSRISAWITALITLERCMCITSPLKVKNIVTPKRVTIVLICVYVILLASAAPVHVVNRLDMKFYPERNKTLIGIIYSELSERVEKYTYVINNVLIPFSAFTVIIICTVTLAVKLRKTTKWRQKSTYIQGDNVSSRNLKVAMMVVMISTLFIASFIPMSFIFIAMTLLPELSIVGRERNLLLVIGGLAVVLESINSSTNIFIYYHMSSNYRRGFRQLFLWGETKTSN